MTSLDAGEAMAVDAAKAAAAALGQGWYEPGVTVRRGEVGSKPCWVVYSPSPPVHWTEAETDDGLNWYVDMATARCFGFGAHGRMIHPFPRPPARHG